MPARDSMKRKALFLVLYTTLMVGYPSVYTLLKSGVAGIFRCLAGDAFLYLSIANNSHGGPFTFDGETATNGFHPMWQWMLTGIFWALDVKAGELQLVLLYSLSAFFVVVGACFANLGILRLTGSAFLSLLTIPGIYYTFFGSLYGNQGIWTQVNGMESALSVFFGGLLIFLVAGMVTRPRTPERFFEDNPPRAFLLAGVTIACVVLSRLDDVFVLLTIIGALLLMPGLLRHRIRAVLCIGAPAALGVAAFLIYNQLAAGAAMPVSGMSKGGLALLNSAYIFAASFLPPLIDLKNALVSRQSDHQILFANAFRNMQMLLPAFFAAAFWFISRPVLGRSAVSRLMNALGAYVVIKALYNFVNVDLFHQGPWYYSFALLITSTLFAVIVARPYALLWQCRPAVHAVRIFYLMFAVLASGWAVESINASTYSEAHVFWEQRHEVARKIREVVAEPRVIEFDDGILNYSLDMPCIHGFCYAGDVATLKAKKEGRLLAHCYQRGFDIIASQSYMDMERALTSSDDLCAWLHASFLDDAIKRELDGYDYELVYLHAATQTPFIRMVAR